MYDTLTPLLTGEGVLESIFITETEECVEVDNEGGDIC